MSYSVNAPRSWRDTCMISTYLNTVYATLAKKGTVILVQLQATGTILYTIGHYNI